MTQLSERDDWFEVWFNDKQSMISTMIQNMVDDIEAGYNYFGDSIIRQRAEIELYKAQFDAEVEAFKNMSEPCVNRWCFYDLKKRGAI